MRNSDDSDTETLSLSLVEDDSSVGTNSIKHKELLSFFTPEQSTRYEFYRASSFHRPTVKKVKEIKIMI